MVVGINTNDQRTTQAKLQLKLKFPLFFKEKILPNLKLVFYDSLSCVIYKMEYFLFKGGY